MSCNTAGYCPSSKQQFVVVAPLLNEPPAHRLGLVVPAATISHETSELEYAMVVVTLLMMQATQFGAPVVEASVTASAAQLMVTWPCDTYPVAHWTSHEVPAARSVGLVHGLLEPARTPVPNEYAAHAQTRALSPLPQRVEEPVHAAPPFAAAVVRV